MTSESLRKSHRHGWATVSTHQVQDGLVAYERCACGAWQIVTATQQTRLEELAVATSRQRRG